MPSRPSVSFTPHQVAGNRWDDTIPSKDTKTNTAMQRLHLIIPARKRSPNLCKTLLSAAILNYPPPTLIGFDLDDKEEQEDTPHTRYVQHTLDFSDEKEVQNNDIVLLLDEYTWLQLPVEMLIKRFERNILDNGALLLKKYGRVNTSTILDKTTFPLPLPPQKYTQKVLFAAQKECNVAHGLESPDCYANLIPQSSLYRRINGKETNGHGSGKNNRPRFIEGALAIGRAGDIKRVWRRTAELAQLQHEGETPSTQNLFTRIFGEQEWNRVQSRKASSLRFRVWLGEKLGYGIDNHNGTMLPSKGPDLNYEFGIGLDYTSSVFQLLEKSRDDVSFVEFGKKNRLNWKGETGRLWGSVKLPMEFEKVGKPMELCGLENGNNETDSKLAIDGRKLGDITWKDIPLAANIGISNSAIPAALNFHLHEDSDEKSSEVNNKDEDKDSKANLSNEWWKNMWYQKQSGELLKKCSNLAGDRMWEIVMGQGEREKWQVWDLRGGSGRIWTGKGEWIEWGEVCGEFEEELFGEGAGGE